MPRRGIPRNQGMNQYEDQSMNEQVEPNPEEQRRQQMNNQYEIWATGNKSFADGLYQRINSLEQSMNTRMDNMESSMNTRMNNMENSMNTRMNNMENSINSLNTRMDNMNTKMDNMKDDIKLSLETFQNVLGIQEVKKRVDKIEKGIKAGYNAYTNNN